MQQTFGINWQAVPPPINELTVLAGDTAGQLSFSLPGSTTNDEKTLAVLAAGLKGVLFIVTGNNGNVTLKTNSTSTPAHTFTFPSGGGELMWTSRSPQSNPFGTTDITTTFWSNAGTTTAQVDVRLLYDS
jgi:hypothetical protein